VSRALAAVALPIVLIATLTACNPFTPATTAADLCPLTESDVSAIAGTAVVSFNASEDSDPLRYDGLTQLNCSYSTEASFGEEGTVASVSLRALDADEAAELQSDFFWHDPADTTFEPRPEWGALAWLGSNLQGPLAAFEAGGRFWNLSVTISYPPVGEPREQADAEGRAAAEAIVQAVIDRA
jgi:hypothetical protein